MATDVVATATVVSTKGATVVSTKGARVRESADLASAIVGELPTGTRLVLGCKSPSHAGRIEVVEPLRGFLTARCVREDEGAAGTPRAPGGGARPPRLFAISDVHADYAENFDWLRETFRSGGFANDGLIVAGDVGSSMDTLRRTLALCVKYFADVAFVVGNHDLWSERGSPGGGDALAKFDRVMALCVSLGVKTGASLMGGCVVAPILSWHHGSWDTEPEVTGWRNIPDHTRCMSDFYRCNFGILSKATDAVAAHFDAANGTLEADVAALRAEHPAAPLVTFSHFVPRLELVQEKRFLYLPTLNKAVGSDFLRKRVDRLRPDVHVFGHTHFGWDATLDGVRYLQGCLAYPSERERRLSTVCASSFPHETGPLLVRDGDGFPPRYQCGWSGYYEHHARTPEVTHILPDYVARQYERIEGVGEVGWGEGIRPAWQYGPLSSREHRLNPASKRSVA